MGSEARLPRIVWLYLIAVALPVSVTLGPVLVTGLRGVLMLVILPLLYQLLSGRLGRIYLTEVFFALHIVWAGLALYVNNPDLVAEQIGSVGVEFVGGYLVGRACIRTPHQFEALCRALVLMVCLTAPLAVFETITGRPLLLEAIRAVSGLRGLEINIQEPRFGLERVQMTFAHPIHYGLFCAVTFAFGFVALRQMRGFWIRSVTSLLIALCGFLALSSGALLAILLQAGLIGWAILFDRLRWRWWLLIGVFFLAYIAVDLLSNRTPIRVFMSYATFSAHTAYWRSIIFDWGLRNVFGDAEAGIRPALWFGLGLRDWVRPWYMRSGSMDNFWLVMVVRYGVPGLAFLAIGFGLGILRILRSDYSCEPILADFRRAWVFAMIGMTFTLCTVHVWSNMYSFIFFIFGAGMWLIRQAPVPGRAGALPFSRFGMHKPARA